MLRYVLFVGITLAVFALGVWRLDEESIWHDEAWSIRAIQSPFRTPDDNTPPLYYLTLHLLQRAGAGESPFALRYGSVLIHLLTVSVGFRIGYRWYGLTAAGITGSLLALSPLLWEYAQEARAYVAVPLIALALLAGTAAFLKPTPSTRKWIFLLAVELAGLYTHNLSVPFVVWVNVIVIGMLVWHSPKKLMFWLFSQFILFLLYLPWLLSQSPSGTPLNTVPKLNFELVKNIWQSYFFPVVAADLPDSFGLKLQLLAAVTLVAGLILLWRERSLKTLLLISQAVLLPVFSTLLIIRASIDFHPRYYVLGVPALVLLLAAAVERLPYKNVAGVILVGLVGLVTQQSLSLIAENRRYQHDDFAAMADYYATLPADALILIPYDHEYTFEIYFRDRIDAQLLMIPLHSPPEEAIQKINAAVEGNQRVELLTWFQLPADERGMYSCLLAAASEEVLDTYEVYGLFTTGFMLSQPIVMQPLQVEANFNSALRLTDVQYAAAQQGVCFQSNWALTRIPESPVYHAAARLLNPFGWELAAGDSLILRDDQARTDDWEVGDSGAAFTFLPLPDGIQDMDYDAVLRLYAPQNLSGWDVVNAKGAPLGKDLRLPKIRLQGQPLLADSAHLTRDNSHEGSLFSGQRLRVEVKTPEAGELVLQGDSWELRENINIGLNWIEFLIPVDAEGEAVLKQEAAVLKSYITVPIERMMTAPEWEIPIDAQFGEVAVLSGATVRVDDGNMQVDLVWQSLTTPQVDYQVFVQLLDENGRLVVQDVTMPDPSPTTTWIEGEYLEDSHNLQLNGLEYRRLIVGLYDPLTAQRVLLLDGADFVEIPIR
ncbi:MAG: hypothetical protein K8I82_23985 [Anaerolineae bacterium]|nr:hypothetical protein [Anaerolineae bacterium]